MAVTSTNSGCQLSDMYTSWKYNPAEARRDNVRLKRNGTPFRSAFVDPLDGYIVETYSYEQVSERGFHHVYYLNPDEQDAMSRGEKIIVWVHDMHTLDFDLRYCNIQPSRMNELVQIIREQIEKI